MTKQKPIFITGNPYKAEYLKKWLGIELEHRAVELDEIQSLDLAEVAIDKAKRAYVVIGRPVLVEDVGITFAAMRGLPGPLIKWFIEEMGLDGICKFVDGLDSRDAECAIVYALYDGEETHLFEARQRGQIAEKPRGTSGFGWNGVFIPDKSSQTYGEMDEATFKEWNIRAHAIEKLRAYLTKS